MNVLSHPVGTNRKINGKPITGLTTQLQRCDPIAGSSSDCAESCESVWSCDMRLGSWDVLLNIGGDICFLS